MCKEYNILLVDDVEINIDILVNILQDEYTLFSALNAIDALEILNINKIDLILLDILMPNINGFELCKKIKLNPKIANIPIIFLTSQDEDENFNSGFDIGAIDYITKPFNATLLKHRVSNYLELYRYQSNLELKVKAKVLENRLYEQIIFQKSKQSEIGELLMHIAHQWKQPLSELSSINIYNMAKLKQDGSIENYELNTSFNKISNTLQFMSDTIQTFQNFYQPIDTTEVFVVSDVIKLAVNMIDATIKFNNIILNIDIKVDFNINGNKNEYAQVILAILNNAKAIHIQRKTILPIINIISDTINHKHTIIITDNGGGISLEPISDIFLPFLSNQNSSGVGLYMSKSIIEKNKGTIIVENIKKGAQFIIRL